MTLSTNVYVLDPIEPGEVFVFCQTMLGRYDEPLFRTPDEQMWSDDAANTYYDEDDQNGVRRMGNRIGQNLPGILDVTYREGGPLRAEPGGHDEDCDEDCSGQYHRRACFLDIDFDTAYGYRDSQKRGCGDLHALRHSHRTPFESSHWPSSATSNEFTGDVHGGDDRYTRLVDLASGGFEATAWFQTSVLPAIAAHMAKESGS